MAGGCRRDEEPILMRLSAYFGKEHLIRDAEVSFGFPPSTRRAGSFSYVTSHTALETANANENVSAIFTTPEMAGGVIASKGCIAVELPQFSFYQFHNALCRSGTFRDNKIAPSATIHPTAVLGRNVQVAPGVCIGAHAVIEDDTIIGNDSLIGPNTVIGGRGLQDTFVDGRNVLVEFAGGVRIGARCEILSGVLIQRPYLSEYTEISDDTKLGPGASIGHSCYVGRAALIGARSVVAGNCRIGEGVWLGAGAIVSDAIAIGDRARIQLGSVVVRDVAADEVVSGNFALPHAQHLRIHTRQLYAH